MYGFVLYDLGFMALFILAVILFLSTRKKNLQRQGVLYLYRTKIGINFINKFSKKFEKILRPLRYVIILSGMILMVSMIWLMIKSTYLYLKFPIARVIKAPPIAPIIPYFPKIFGLESFFPPLYFTYFVIILAIVIITHEFAHGIFAKLENFKIHSTGFAFLGPILGAFVEPDEKQMAKAKKFPQMSVLAAGTFANIIMTIIFGLILLLFFSSFFVPAGVKFNSYAIAQINTSDVIVIGNSTIAPEKYVEIKAYDRTFFAEKDTLKNSLENNLPNVFVYYDSPAFREQIRGAITEIDGEKVTSMKSLSEVLQDYRPGDKVNVKTAILDPGQGTVAERKEYEVELGNNDGKAFLGVGFLPVGSNGFLGKLYDKIFAKVKNPFVHYDSNIGGFGWFIYYLLWWIVFINFAVALFNMLPLGILDGGRFFYLAIWAITGKENIGKKAFAGATWFILGLLLLMMIKWAFTVF
ncbi:site-2 protease family protein [Candidatus Pacearchaeota archaeon]|nr:site-2 protease family protein [Candidatus Pacearchaeota archaeon]